LGSESTGSQKDIFLKVKAFQPNTNQQFDVTHEIHGVQPCIVP